MANMLLGLSITPMDIALSTACENYRAYLANILSPASAEFLRKVSENDVGLHDAFGTNLFVAHAVDYILAIRIADGLQPGRAALVRTFDERFSVSGARFGRKKFELIDAVNNALKHIQLREDRHENVISSYGSISFNCLVQHEGRILCLLDGYRFDYARVVLRPAIQALIGCHLGTAESVLEFARGDFVPEALSPDSEWDDPIDQMIAHCNPSCDDCNELEDSCMCGTFVYVGKKGSFAPAFNVGFDFDEVMSRISGAYRKDC